VVADHDQQHLNPGTLNTITAASQLGDVEVLVAGGSCGGVASEAAKVKGVKKVITVESADLKNFLAERLTEVTFFRYANSNLSGGLGRTRQVSVHTRCSPCFCQR
jgi:electron transfer flavoprotein alpha subunit